ncbi:hypothetical protein [Nocardia puris]
MVAVLDGVGHVPGESLDSLTVRLRAHYRLQADTAETERHGGAPVEDERY